MISLWDTTGDEVVKALSAERRSAGGVTSGLALTLVAVVDEKHVREAEAAATIAAAQHPCRMLMVVRADVTRDNNRLDAEIVVDNTGRVQPLTAAITDLVEDLLPIARRLDCAEELEAVPRLMDRGASYQRQRAAAAANNRFVSQVHDVHDSEVDVTDFRAVIVDHRNRRFLHWIDGDLFHDFAAHTIAIADIL